MEQPVVVTAVFQPLPGHRDETRAALQAALPAVHAEEGCLLYALHDAENGSLVLIEKWASRELLNTHAAGKPVAQLNKSLTGLLQAAPSVVTMTPVPHGDAAKGQL